MLRLAASAELFHLPRVAFVPVVAALVWYLVIHGNYLAAIKMVKMQGGVFGAVARSDDFVDAVKGLA